tara:strand:- start:151 stop:1845 length:1695 start_codon:yes stop_codon:yes gene_type:complete
MQYVFVPMCADIFHIAHLNILKKAAGYGPVVVLLMSDNAMASYKRTPLIGYEERKDILLAIKYVNDVIPCDGPHTYGALVSEHMPKYFVHGDDWKQGIQSNPRQDVIDVLKTYGGQMVEPAYTPGISSTQLHETIDKISLKKQGVLIQTSMNDLKRTASVLAREMNVDCALLNSVVEGSMTNTIMIEDIVTKIMKYYPINPRHIVLSKDQSCNGMWHMSLQQTQASARVFERSTADDNSVPYYRYMDTSTSATAPFKPELIEMLVHVNDNSPLNPKVVMNKGHLLTQQTFFIGPVNFYCTIQGVRYCKPMNTGDSCLITPYVPHSFTKREPSAYAAIVAVTFSGIVRDVLPELMRIDMQKCLQHAGDARAPVEARQKRLLRYAELRGLSLDELMTQVQDRMMYDGNSRDIPQLYLQQQNMVISDILNVSEAVFELRQLTRLQEVTYASRGESTQEKVALASSLHIPETGGFDWHFSSTRTLEAGFFSYIYNYGENNVTMNGKTLASGDSAVLKPFTNVTMVPSGHARLLVVYVGGWVSEPLLNEMSTFAAEGRQRIATNNSKWW